MRLSYVASGTHGVPVVLMHGMGNDSSVWADVFAANRTGRSVFALDLRGHGDSDHAADAQYSLDLRCEDLEDFFRVAGLNTAVLVGHSIGGIAAAVFASRHAGRTAGLVLVDCGPVSNRGALAHVRDRMAQIPTHFASVSEYELLLKTLYPLASARTLRALAASSVRRSDAAGFSLKLDPRFSAAIGSAKGRSDDELWELLRQIPCKTLVVRGLASSLLDMAVAQRMARQALTDGELQVIKRAGHCVMIDNPEDFVAVLWEFLSRIEPVAEAAR
jgi:pimeloyl-ACP methyl ester carboxylesterase